ncbi:hypothetical protein J4228_04175 [Candidatus Woesearchaeota archaeon]|nr:hypothetical protein [Candidatus Woesearchaeota archaeon]
MEIKDLQANKGNIDVVVNVIAKEEPRTFEKFGKAGRVCTVKVKDDSGEIKVTLWNEDVDKIGVGDKVHIQNGWCSEYKGEKQLSTGKFGKIEIIERAAKEVFTNSPEMLNGEMMDDGSEDEEDVVSGEEEFVE